MSYFDAYFTFANRTGMQRADFPSDLLNRQQFYVRLVDFLAPAYPALSPRDLATVAGVGYLYFQFYLSVDTVMDEKVLHPDDKRMLLKRLGYFEQAMSDLGRIFPAESPFWSRFALCKQQFYRAGAQEKAISENRPAFSDTLFLELAEGKSALCFATVHALDCLDGREQPSAGLLQCLREIHLAFQYRDDLGDFGKDVASGQWTQAQDHVREYLEREGLLDEVSPAEWHNVLYTSRIAHRMIERAIDGYTAALASAEANGLAELTDFLHREIKDCRGQIFEIDLLLRKTEALARRAANPRIRAAAFDAEAEGRLAEGFATRFLVTELANWPAGWADFMTTAGEGEGWVTGFVAMQLVEAGVETASLDRILAVLQRSPGAGTYNESVQRDGDSCTFLYGALQAARRSVTPSFLARWTAFQDADGGWVTYRGGEQLAARLEIGAGAGVAGWLSPKACVTAAAAYVLAGADTSPGRVNSSLAYLRARQRTDGSVPAYWWTSDVYATAWALLFAVRVELNTADPFATGLRGYLTHTQTDLGYWENGCGEPCPFYTALALRALLASGTPATDGRMRLAYRWLLREQREDGSWLATRKLRIPAPHVEDPACVRKWRNSSFGTNVLVDDHNRYFTSATVLCTLHAYRVGVDHLTALSTATL